MVGEEAAEACSDLGGGDTSQAETRVRIRISPRHRAKSVISYNRFLVFAHRPRNTRLNPASLNQSINGKVSGSNLTAASNEELMLAYFSSVHS